jgi:hypothetical protein|tara:strand:- start:3905 stop:4189 length:285 start_codon:yes stop_codon:yes gene_type:complete
MKDRKKLEYYLEEGWRADKDPDGIKFYGIGVIIAPSGTCYPDRIYFGELCDNDSEFEEWDEECQDAQWFSHRVVDYINNGGSIEELADYLNTLS